MTMTVIAEIAPVAAHTPIDSGFAAMPMSSAVVGRSESARSCVPIVVRRSSSAQPSATRIASATITTVTQLTTTPAAENAGPDRIGANGCGLFPNRMNDSEMSMRSGATVIADRSVTEASESHVAAIQPMMPLRRAPITTPAIVASQIGRPSEVASQTAEKAANMPVAACAKFTTRTSRDIRVSVTASTA